MARQFSKIQKFAFGFAALFLGVYSLDYVPGIRGENGLMFGLFHMTPLVDLGHLGAGTLALIGGLVSAKAARFYFWLLGAWYTLDVLDYFIVHLHKISVTTNVLVNLPHVIIFLAAYWVALNVDKPESGAAAA